MRSIAVCALLLAACESSSEPPPLGLKLPSPAPLAKPSVSAPPVAKKPVVAEPPRAAGAGFTVVLPAGWTVEPAAEGQLFRAASPEGSKVVMLAGAPEVIENEASCRAGVASMAEQMHGEIEFVRFASGVCSGEIVSPSLAITVDVRVRGERAIHTNCAGTMTMRYVCADVLATWRDDPSARLLRQESRLTTERTGGRIVVRSKQLSISFPGTWTVKEGSGTKLVEARSGNELISIADLRELTNALTEADCREAGEIAAEGRKTKLVATRVDDRQRCHATLEDPLFRRIVWFRSSERTMAMYCGAELATCDEVLATLVVN